MSPIQILQQHVLVFLLALVPESRSACLQTRLHITLHVTSPPSAFPSAPRDKRQQMATDAIEPNRIKSTYCATFSPQLLTALANRPGTYGSSQIPVIGSKYVRIVNTTPPLLGSLRNDWRSERKKWCSIALFFCAVNQPTVPGAPSSSPMLEDHGSESSTWMK